LRRALSSHDVATAYEMGWAQLTNGLLLKEAEASFDIFVTTDQNLQYQQNLSGRRLAILALWTTSWPKLQRQLQQIIAAIEKLTAGDFIDLNRSESLLTLQIGTRLESRTVP
jgi:hypothetical protein